MLGTGRRPVRAGSCDLWQDVTAPANRLQAPSSVASHVHDAACPSPPLGFIPPTLSLLHAPQPWAPPVCPIPPSQERFGFSLNFPGQSVQDRGKGPNKLSCFPSLHWRHHRPSRYYGRRPGHLSPLSSPPSGAESATDTPTMTVHCPWPPRSLLTVQHANCPSPVHCPQCPGVSPDCPACSLAIPRLVANSLPAAGDLPTPAVRCTL